MSCTGRTAILEGDASAHTHIAVAESSLDTKGYCAPSLLRACLNDFLKLLNCSSVISFINPSVVSLSCVPV